MAGGMATASGPKRKKAKKVFDHLRIYHGSNGEGKPEGYVVEHHYRMEGGEGYNPTPEPEKVPFGKDQGEEMLAHIAKHMNVDSAENKENEDAGREQEHETGEGGGGGDED